jgi:Fatty acid hydroxylase
MPTMLPEGSVREIFTAQGRKIKRDNLIAAMLSGVVLVGVSIRFFPSGPARFLLGLVVGFFYANGFEYCLHRYLLHLGRGLFYQQHMIHHVTWQSPEVGRYVNFSSNPWGVVGLIVLNAVPFLGIERVFHPGMSTGVLTIFCLYYMAFEEIHWRSHMGGWLPQVLRPAAKHHLLHHVHDDGRFNVFLPICDHLLRSQSRLGRGNQTERAAR